MFQLTRPDRETVRKLMLSVEHCDFNYAEHSLFDRDDSAGYLHHLVTKEVGTGAEAFEVGKKAFRSWKMFPAVMVDLIPLREEIAVGNVVAIVARGGGLWSYNACRIFDVIDDETDSERRFGFTYASLPGHVARGEERFLLRHNRATDQVAYEIEVYSQPDHWLARLATPYFRHVQRRFRRLSGEGIKDAIASGNQVPPSPIPTE